MGLSNSGWTASKSGACRCTGRTSRAFCKKPSESNHLRLDHAHTEGGSYIGRGTVTWDETLFS